MEKRLAPQAVLGTGHETHDAEPDSMDVEDDPAKEAVEDEEFEQFLDDLRRRKEHPDANNTEYAFNDAEDDDDETLVTDADDFPIPSHRCYFFI